MDTGQIVTMAVSLIGVGVTLFAALMRVRLDLERRITAVETKLDTLISRRRA